ncbi:hypothetical protein LCGC14_1843000 [marine sediment metagenome]|uniref:Uncharacterized protein n=1 Tax=marine sediment metagenome TaxID=412755 RepID=A0A0F9GCN5_9ZZZZ
MTQEPMTRDKANEGVKLANVSLTSALDALAKGRSSGSIEDLLVLAQGVNVAKAGVTGANKAIARLDDDIKREAWEANTQARDDLTHEVKASLEGVIVKGKATIVKVGITSITVNVKLDDQGNITEANYKASGVGDKAPSKSSGGHGGPRQGKVVYEGEGKAWGPRDLIDAYGSQASKERLLGLTPGEASRQGLVHASDAIAKARGFTKGYVANGDSTS